MKLMMFMFLLLNELKHKITASLFVKEQRIRFSYTTKLNQTQKERDVSWFFHPLDNQIFSNGNKPNMDEILNGNI